MKLERKTEMIKITGTDVYGFEAAIRGMRNPLNSWEKSDSDFNVDLRFEDPMIGIDDIKLMTKLVKSGSDHRKFMRMIIVSADILAPLYWWKEYDTYKVGTVANSCSTMHKIHDKKFNIDDFSHEHIHDLDGEDYELSVDELTYRVNILNYFRDRFLETKEKKYWWQMIQKLPSSYNQLRTVQLNYEVLYNIYFARKDHKLDEWHVFCDWIKTLPYMKDFLEA